MKVARPVWSGGKGGDNFKTLPIAIPVMNGYKEMSWLNRNNGLTVTDLTYRL